MNVFVSRTVKSGINSTGRHQNDVVRKFLFRTK